MNKSNINSLYDLVDEYILDFHEKEHLSYIVKPSIPIVWFGNIYKYLKSELRIVTIGLNPSNREFPCDENPRFSSLDTDNTRLLVETLNKYFEHNPYKKWFNHYEKLLNLECFKASYYQKTGYTNIAIHIDAHSAIATNPTWGNLSRQQQKDLEPKHNIFLKLFKILKPNVILFSAGKVKFNSVFRTNNEFIFTPIDDGYYEKLSNKNPNRIIGYIRLYHNDDNSCILLWGSNRGIPFAGMSDKENDKHINSLMSRFSLK